MKNIEVNEPEKLSPIWICNVDYSISTRGKISKHKAKKIVLKGNFHEIKKDILSKKRILKAHFIGQNDIKKKVMQFDYLRLSILNVEFVKLIGHGISRI